MAKEYQICTRCVMDTTTIDINFNSEGVCNYCIDFISRYQPMQEKSIEQREKELSELIEIIKSSGKGKRYDCIIGLSGGVDSSWVLVQAVKYGLRPLAVHMDNGWNSELAQNNIANLVRELKIDLYTHVIDWSEYKRLMQSFFEADVIDIELLYDNATLGVNYQLAAKYGVKFILAGTNQATEGISFPKKWNWFKFDKKNIKSISKKFSGLSLVTFPAIGTIDYVWYEYFRKIRWVSYLDFFDYNKNKVLDTLEKEYGYNRYPYKHYESIFTRFYQGYILPQKFNIDKRILHFSTLIASGQMSREEAVSLLKKPAFISERHLNDDKNYFLKKMGWSNDQLDEYLRRPQILHSVYGSEKSRWDFIFQDGNDRYVFKVLLKIYKWLKK